MIVSYGQSAHDNQPTRHECTFEQLCAWLRSMYEARTNGPKGGAYLSFADYAGINSKGEQGVRSYECLLASYAVPLDLDLGKYVWTPEAIASRLAGYQYIAWTSYSHDQAAPRWRIVVPVERGMNADEHRGTWVVLASLFANDCGESSKDATRLNYLPGLCAHPEQALFMSSDGVPLPVQAPVADVGKSDTGSLSDEPVGGWDGPTDDDELIAHMLTVRTKAEDAFAPPGTLTRFEALWYGDAAALSTRHPAKEPHQAFDHTAADLALANELAYYTGSHGTRCLELFERSALAQRDSYREDKGVRAITRACTGRTMHAFMHRKAANHIHDTPAHPGHVAVTGNTYTAPTVPAPPAPGQPEVIPDTNRLTTDQANAQRLYKAFGAHLLSAAGEFYSWTGTHWQGGPRHPLRLGFNLSALIDAEIKPMRERHTTLQASGNLTSAQASEWEYLDEMIPSLGQWAAKSEQLHVVEAALRALKTLLDVPMTSFDASPWLLNCRNGTVDLRTGTLKAHDPADRITRCIALDYLPDEACPRFERFLAEVFPDPRTVEYVQRYFGYSITGSNREQTMLVHWGSGSNGKNTLLKALRLAMGPYAMAGTAGLLTVDKEAAMIHEIADLYGSRLVTIDETSDGARLNESSFKRVTGDDNVRGRHLYKSFFEYRPTYKLHLLTNHKPRVVNTDNGVWRRLRLLPYTQAFTADNGRIDKGLDETLENEMHGILAWLVAGAARWHTGGLKMCPEVAEASAAYRSEEDMLGQFLGERCVVGPEFETPVAALYSSYSAWARDNGAFVMSKKRLVGDILERPIAVQRVLTGGTKNIVTLRGFKLLAV
jgi:P4 family phage/plasmid primase-like protien